MPTAAKTVVLAKELGSLFISANAHRNMSLSVLDVVRDMAFESQVASGMVPSRSFLTAFILCKSLRSCALGSGTVGRLVTKLEAIPPRSAVRLEPRPVARAVAWICRIVGPGRSSSLGGGAAGEGSGVVVAWMREGRL